MDKQKMTFWGIGPMYLSISLCVAAGGAAVQKLSNPLFAVTQLHPSIFPVAGSLLILAGAAIWLRAFFVAKISRAVRENQLLTSDIYGLTRNPIYLAIWMILTGSLCWLQSWILLVVPVVNYIALRLLLRKEEDTLTKVYGKEYLDYKRRVNAVFPTIQRN